MTAHVTTQASPFARSDLLRYALRGDAIFSIATGAICLADAQPLATLFGIQPPLALEILGAVLALYGAFLFYIAAQAQLNRRIVIAAIVLRYLGYSTARSCWWRAGCRLPAPECGQSA